MVNTDVIKFLGLTNGRFRIWAGLCGQVGCRLLIDFREKREIYKRCYRLDIGETSIENKNALVQAMMDVEYYPPSVFVKMNIDMTEMQKFPIEKAAALGVAFQPLTQLVSYAVGGAGQSGLYFVNTAGKTMFQSGGQFIGNLQAANGGVGGGLARMTQVPLDPTMLCMAVAIMAV